MEPELGAEVPRCVELRTRPLILWCALILAGFVIVWEGLLGHGWVAGPVWLGVAATAAALALMLRES